MRAVEHYLNATTSLPAVLLELVRLRVSIGNGCEFCIGHHTLELRKHHEPESRIEAVKNWPQSEAFTRKERAALAWADSVSEIQSRYAADEDYATVSAFFHGKDLVDLTLAIASINAWNRLSIAFRAEWGPDRHSEQQSSPGRTNGDLSASPPHATETEAGNQSMGELRTSAISDDGGKVAQD